VPDDLDAALTVTDLADVAAEDARALGDEQEFSCGGVVDRFCHGGDGVAGQVGLDACSSAPAITVPAIT